MSALASAPSRVLMHNRLGELTMPLEEGKVFFGPGSDCPFTTDVETGERRPAATRDPERLRRAARAVRAPTLLVRGRKSELVTAEGVREFLALVPHARFVDVAEAGHMVAGDRNDVFTEAVRGFLAELRDEEPGVA